MGGSRRIVSEARPHLRFLRLIQAVKRAARAWRASSNRIGGSGSLVRFVEASPANRCETLLNFPDERTSSIWSCHTSLSQVFDRELKSGSAELAPLSGTRGT
jgi:hypothetical protein